MLGISYGELFLLLGATAALIGPKDLPIIARTAGSFAGRSIGYFQLARGQFESVMQQSQARQVHKELQDTIAQLEAIRHEIRTISFMNPGPMTSRLVDSINTAAANNAGISLFFYLTWLIFGFFISSSFILLLCDAGKVYSSLRLWKNLFFFATLKFSFLFETVENGPKKSEIENTIDEKGL